MQSRYNTIWGHFPLSKKRERVSFRKDLAILTKSAVFCFGETEKPLLLLAQWLFTANQNMFEFDDGSD